MKLLMLVSSDFQGFGAPVASVAIGIAAVLALIGVEKCLDMVATSARIERLRLLPIARVFRAVVVLTACMLVLDVFGFEIQGLWTALSAVLALVAVGFVAFWSVLSNFTCALMFLVQRPFVPGDTVEFPGDSLRGKVVDFNLSHTTLEEDGGNRLRVPNNLFFQRIFRVLRKTE